MTTVSGAPIRASQDQLAGSDQQHLGVRTCRLNGRLSLIALNDDTEGVTIEEKR